MEASTDSRILDSILFFNRCFLDLSWSNCSDVVVVRDIFISSQRFPKKIYVSVCKRLTQSGVGYLELSQM